MQIPSWTQLGSVLSTNTSRVIYALPVAGYVILYSDYFHYSLLKFSALSSWGFLSFDHRINCIYYGSWLLLVAFGLWWFFCPPLLRGKRDLQHFVSDVVVARDRSTVLTVAKSAPFTLDQQIIGTVLNEVDLIGFRNLVDDLKARGPALGDGAGEFEYRIPTALALYFKWHNARRPALRAVITAFAGAGYILVLVLPSLDLFLRVLGTHYHRLLS